MRDKCKRKRKCETNVNLEQYSSLGQSCCCSEHRAQEIVRNFPGEQKLPSPCKPICSLARASVFVNIFKLQPHILNTIRMQSNKTLKHSPKTPLNHTKWGVRHLGKIILHFLSDPGLLVRSMCLVSLTE